MKGSVIKKTQTIKYHINEQMTGKNHDLTIDAEIKAFYEIQHL